MYKKLIIAFLIVLSVVTYINSHNSNSQSYKGTQGVVIKV